MSTTGKRRRIAICGAAGRDFHNFNMVYRDDPTSEVVVFTGTQIPGIANRTYPRELAGPLYPNGIPILPQSELESLICDALIDEVVFAYSDVTHQQVMHLAARVIAAGANFSLLGTHATQIACTRPVVAISAVRTGCGKSQIARYLSEQFRASGISVAVLRHPMPYGDLKLQGVQRFATLADLNAANCTIEEREEYEPHIAAGNLVFAGVDYAAIAQAAAAEADLIVWDGGNNDLPFLQPDVHIVVTDALRPDQLTTHHPGESALLSADIVVINKADAASDAVIESMICNIRMQHPDVPVVIADSPVQLDCTIPATSKVLVVEDGPTLTHGGMSFGAGWQAVTALDVDIVDPRDSATRDIAALYEDYPHIGLVLPAMGYSPAQVSALKSTIENSTADVVVAGTPIDLAQIVKLDKPVVRARYNYQQRSGDLLALITQRLPTLQPESQEQAVLQAQ